MLAEVPNEQIEEYAALFPGAQAQMVLASVAEGNTGAQCWSVTVTNAVPANEAVLLWDKGNIVFYVAGEASSGTVADTLATLVIEIIEPNAEKEGLRYFSVCALTPQMERVLLHIFRDVDLHPVDKRFYTYQHRLIDEIPAPTLDGVDFLPIDADLLNSNRFANVQQVEDEVRWMWTTMERFYRQGFGVAARWEDQLVCWCTAEYMSHSQCGVGIETVAEFQGKNIATATAARFVAESLARGIQPHWECNLRNPASARVAEKVGFTLTTESTFWAGRFRNS